MADRGRLPERARRASVQVQLGGALAVVQPSVRARVAPPEAGRLLLFRHDALRGRHGESAGRHEARRNAGHGESGSVYRYSVSKTVSFGLRYRFMTEEDMVGFEAAESGSLQSGYENHRFLVGARWQF